MLLYTIPPMPLSFPTGLQNLINSGWCRYHPFVELYLNDGTVLRYSTVNLNVGGVSYDDKLKNISGGKIGMTSSVDRVSFTLYNADAIAGNQLLTTRTPLERTKAIIGTIYINIQDSSEAYRIIEDDGIVNASSATDIEVECVFISATYTENSICGDIAVTVPCSYLYKGKDCGYVGSIATCDQAFAGKNGCTVHFDYETARLQFGGHGLFLDDAYKQQVKPIYKEPEERPRPGRRKKYDDDDDILPGRYRYNTL